MTGNVHDLLFRSTFSQVEHAASLLKLLLPKALVEHIDWSTLTLCPGSFIDEALTERVTDLLFSVLFAGRPMLLYLLFEHQSTLEERMSFRLLRYEVRIWESFLNDTPAAKRLPAILTHRLASQP